MTQIPKIQKKLREAQFFFRHVCDKERALNLESEALEFYLSAFLSAGRGVIGFFYEKQNKQCRLWFREWKMALADGDRKLLNEMTRQRDAEVHKQGAEVHADFEMVPLMKIMGPRGRNLYGPYEFDAPGIPPSAMAVKVLYFEMGDTKEEVIETCQRYVELLEKLVREFDQAPIASRLSQPP